MDLCGQTAVLLLLLVLLLLHMLLNLDNVYFNDVFIRRDVTLLTQVHLCLNSLETPPVAYTGEACVAFYYHMLGKNVRDLAIYTSGRGSQSPLKTYSGNKGNTWILGNVTVTLNNDRVSTMWKDIMGLIDSSQCLRSTLSLSRLLTSFKELHVSVAAILDTTTHLSFDFGFSKPHLSPMYQPCRSTL